MALVITAALSLIENNYCIKIVLTLIFRSETRLSFANRMCNRTFQNFQIFIDVRFMCRIKCH